MWAGLCHSIRASTFRFLEVCQPIFELTCAPESRLRVAQNVEFRFLFPKDSWSTKHHDQHDAPLCHHIDPRDRKWVECTHRSSGKTRPTLSMKHALSVGVPKLVFLSCCCFLRRDAAYAYTSTGHSPQTHPSTCVLASTHIRL